MGTPFIAHLEPSKLEGYDRGGRFDEQREGIPRTFCDAMAVREAVFVEEQGVPLGCEHDDDDARSCHWVIYASSRAVVAPQVVDPATNLVLQPQRSETLSVPIGTLRVVPYPHPPHPVPGGRYVDNQLVVRPPGLGGGDASSDGEWTLVDDDESDDPVAEALRPRPPGIDRATTLHTGLEPYVKIGRLAVIPRYRGLHMAGQLWHAAREWLEQNPRYFERDVSTMSAEELEARRQLNPPHWNGLVCVHAQDRPEVIKTYQKWGFHIDEKMGRWWEEDIPHVGMFIRLNIKHTGPSLAATHVA